MTGMPSVVVPGDSMDPMHGATAIVASPAWDLGVAAEASIAAAAASIVAVEALVVAAAASGVAAEAPAVAADARAVAAVVAGKRCES